MRDKFVFYSKSANKKAGFGTGEEKNTKIQYSDLEKIKDWRKVLSNFYISPFIIDDNTWNSVEHFFHAVKFRNGKKPSKEYDFYKTFTLDSNSPWCEQSFLAKQAGKAGRVSKITGKTFRKKIGGVNIPEDIKMRQDFYTGRISEKLQKIAFLAKFTQNPELKHILLATKDAELWHFTGRGGRGNILIKELMICRDCIRKYDNKCDLSIVSMFSSDSINKIL